MVKDKFKRKMMPSWTLSGLLLNLTYKEVLSEELKLIYKKTLIVKVISTVLRQREMVD